MISSTKNQNAIHSLLRKEANGNAPKAAGAKFASNVSQTLVGADRDSFLSSAVDSIRYDKSLSKEAAIARVASRYAGSVWFESKGENVRTSRPPQY